MNDLTVLRHSESEETIPRGQSIVAADNLRDLRSLEEMTAEEIYSQVQRVHRRRTLIDELGMAEQKLPDLTHLMVVDLGHRFAVIADSSQREDDDYAEKAWIVASMLRKQKQKAGVRAKVEMVPPDVFATLQGLSSRVTSHGQNANRAIYQFYVSLLRRALEIGASDIHIVLINNFGNVVYRVNGRLVVEANPKPISTYVELCNHIYNMRDTGGDGNWQPTKSCNGVDNVMIDGIQTRWRFHSFPNEDNEHAHIVLRRNNITQPTPYGNLGDWHGKDEDRVRAELLALGYLEQHCDQLMRMFASPDGGIFVSGKTNSGKTTLINHALSGIQALTNFQRMLICIEDVPELSIPRAVRTPVSLDKANSFTFSDAIKSALRRDADIIVVGEIRERDSGPAVVQAVLSGHLVIASLHTNNIVSMLDRLHMLDVSREFLAGAGNLAGLVWQRLLPTLCERCKRPVMETDPAFQRLKMQYPEITIEGLYRHNPHGCQACKGMPSGRVVAAEIMDFPNAQMRRAILERDEISLMDEWRAQGDERHYPVGLRAVDHAVHHAKAGLVCLNEIEAQLGRFDRCSI